MSGGSGFRDAFAGVRLQRLAGQILPPDAPRAGDRAAAAQGPGHRSSGAGQGRGDFIEGTGFRNRGAQFSPGADHPFPESQGLFHDGYLQEMRPCVRVPELQRGDGLPPAVQGAGLPPLRGPAARAPNLPGVQGGLRALSGGGDRAGGPAGAGAVSRHPGCPDGPGYHPPKGSPW